MSVIGACLLAVGCAAIRPDAGFEQVAGAVRERTGHELRLQDPGAPDATVTELLAQPLTLFKAVQVALLNNPELQAAYAQLQRGAADRREAATLDNPMLALTVLDPEEGGSRSIEADLLGPLLGLILRGPSRSIAEREWRQVQAETVEAVIELAAEVERAWYEHLAARAKLTVAKLMLEAADVGRLLADRFAAAGNITPLETALHADAAGVAQSALVEARLAADRSRLELSSLLGLMPDADWAPAGDLPGLPGAWPETDELWQRALDEHPSLAVAGLELDKLALALSMEQRFRVLGDLDIGLAWERETDRSELYGVALELSLPIFHQNQAEIGRAQAALRRAGWTQRATLGRLAGEVHLAAAALDAAAARAMIHRDTIIPARRQAVDFVLREYNYMLTGVFDLIEVREREFEAWAGYVEAVADFWLAAADLRRAVGGRLDLEPGDPILLPELEHGSDQGHDHHGTTSETRPETEADDQHQHEAQHDHTP